MCKAVFLIFCTPIKFFGSKPLLAPGDGPIALVLVPTRELAVQIQHECPKFGYGLKCYSRIRNTAIHGSAPKVPQIRNLHS